MQLTSEKCKTHTNIQTHIHTTWNMIYWKLALTLQRSSWRGLHVTVWWDLGQARDLTAWPLRTNTFFPLWATKTKLPSSLDFYPCSAPARARMITGTLMSLNVMEENERREEKRCNVPLMSFLHAPHLLSFSLISVSFSSGQSISASLFSSLSLMSILNL